MSRRTKPAQAIAERTFAVRVHVRIPEGGFRQRNDFEVHLRTKLGTAFYLGSERGFGVGMSSLVVYANDLGAVLEAVQRFGVEINLHRAEMCG